MGDRGLRGDDQAKRTPEQEKWIRGLEDPVAELTGWDPATDRGSNFLVQELVETSAHRLEFRATRGVIRFCRLIMGVGALLVALSIPAIVQGLGYPAVAGPVTGGLIAAAGYALQRFAARPRVFDRTAGWYWEGRPPPEGAGAGSRRNAVRLDRIHAVQLLMKTVTSTSADNAGPDQYANEEINLVLEDGTRLNVCSQPGPLGTDAGTIARFLDVPVW